MNSVLVIRPVTERFNKFALEGVALQGVLSVLSFTWVALLARYLSVSTMGSVMVAIAASTTIVAFCGFGLQHSISVNACKYDDLSAVTNGLLAICIAGGIAGIVGYGVASFTPASDSLEISEVVCGITIAAQLIQVYLSSVMRAIYRFRLANALSIIQPSILNIMFVVNIVQGRTLSARIIFIEYLLSIVFSILTYFILFFRLNLLKASAVDLGVVGMLFKFGYRAQIGNALKEVMYRADIFLVSFVLGSVTAGFYAVVLKLIEGFGRFVDALGLVLLPTIAKLGNPHRNELTERITLVTVGFAFIMSLGVAANGTYVVEIVFGQNFQPSVRLLEIGIFAMIPLFAWKVLANDFIARGALGYYAASAALGAFSTISVNYWLLSDYGVIVAPWVLIFSYSVSASMLIAFAYCRFGMSWKRSPIRAKQLGKDENE